MTEKAAGLPNVGEDHAGFTCTKRQGPCIGYAPESMSALALLSLALSSPYGHDHYVARDGAWCWFADPRAIWVGDKVLAGAVSGEGDIRVHLYDPKTKKSSTAILAGKFEKDDHDNPSFLRLKDGRVMAFFSKHTGKDLFASTSDPSSGFAKWTEPVKISPNDPDYQGPKGALNAYTYPNPQMLSQERSRIYLFWRGMNWKPTFSTSDDQGKTWSKGRILISPKDEAPGNRPYLKAAGDGKSTIHLAFTDGHPRNEPSNSIFYLQIRSGEFRKAAGERIGSLAEAPLEPSKAEVVYDGKANGARAWIWDVAHDAKGRPHITYSRLPAEDRHEYRYAWWNGERWVDQAITPAGKWFPQTPDGQKEREPHYSGGVVLDPKDPRIVYLSRPVGSRFEIERWFTEDGGKTWSHVSITGESKHDSVRPFVIRGSRPKGTGPNALWMNFTKYRHYTDFSSTIQAADEDLAAWSEESPLRTAEAVWKWARSNPPRHRMNDWTVAPLLIGLLDYAEASGNPLPSDWVKGVGESLKWQMGPRKGMADDVAVGQAFLQLYEKERKRAMIGPVKDWITAFAQRPHNESMEWKNGIEGRQMAWCDALFMGPPAIAQLARITRDQALMDRTVGLWWKTSDYLYDPKEKLMFRDSRYFTKKEANGQKVFWSRGNGWVLAGLARVLVNLPTDHPGRPRLERQFKEMSHRIAKLQTKDGTWHASLLDPAAYPSQEASGTGFFVYAMAWGVNAGLLDPAAFKPVVRRGFGALTRMVDLNGRVGWVQPIGADPKPVMASHTDSYGVGAFLMAACQVEELSRPKG